MNKIYYMFILNTAEKPKAKYSESRDTSVGIGNFSFLYGCHWYNDKWADNLNKWRFFQIDERVYTKDLRGWGGRIPRVFKEHQTDLYDEAEWPRGSIVRDKVRIVYESKGIVDHAPPCLLQEWEWLLLSVKCGAIGEFEQTSDRISLNFLNDYSAVLRRNYRGTKWKQLRTWD